LSQDACKNLQDDLKRLDESVVNNSFFEFNVANYQTQVGQGFSDHLAGFYTDLGTMPSVTGRIIFPPRKRYASNVKRPSYADKASN
jgi:hypothetical protein